MVSSNFPSSFEGTLQGTLQGTFQSTLQGAFQSTLEGTFSRADERPNNSIPVAAGIPAELDDVDTLVQQLQCNG